MNSLNKAGKTHACLSCSYKFAKGIDVTTEKKNWLVKSKFMHMRYRVRQRLENRALHVWRALSITTIL